MSLLQRFLHNEYTAVMLAPSNLIPHQSFGQPVFGVCQHCLILRGVQQLRAISYLHRNLISADELAEGQRYPTSFDSNSWHFVVFKQGKIVGFIKSRIYSENFPLETLKTFQSINRLPDHQKQIYLRALDCFIQASRLSRSRFGEGSSWITAPEASSTSIGLFLLLTIFAFYDLQGHAMGVAITRADNGASRIIEAICGSELSHAGQALPTFYDPFYKAEQRVLTFDTRQISAKYRHDIEQIKEYLSNIKVYYSSLPHKDQVLLETREYKVVRS